MQWKLFHFNQSPSDSVVYGSLRNGALISWIYLLFFIENFDMQSIRQTLLDVSLVKGEDDQIKKQKEKKSKPVHN